MSTETHDHDSVPSTGRERILAVLKDDIELLEDALNHEDGYTHTVMDEMASRWGDEYIPDSCPAYISVVKKNHLQELEEQLENHQMNSESVAELSSPEIEAEPSTDKGRCKAIIQNTDEFLEQAAVDELDYKDVKDAVTEEWGVLYSPTEDTVRDAVSELRLAGEIPRDGVDLREVDEIQKIIYQCDLCRDFEARTQTEMRDHLGYTDDAVHDGWNASDFQPVSIRCEPIEETHDVLESDAFQEDVDQNYGLLRAVYYNPDVRQRDIADMIGMTQSGLSQKLSEFDWSWDTCHDDIEHLLETWDEQKRTEQITKEHGNVTYQYSSTGIDTTSGRGTQTIDERPQKGANISITLTEEEARAFLSNENETPVREKILNELL